MSVKHKLAPASAAKKADGTFDLSQIRENVNKGFENIQNGHTKLIDFSESPDSSTGNTVYTLTVNHNPTTED